MNNLLAICIPTYNRASILRKNLSVLVNTVRPYDIPIYISDNASDDETEDVVKVLQNEYKYIFYSVNPANLGFAVNFQTVLNAPDTDYRWLLGDDDTILDHDGFKKVLQYLQKDRPDILVCGGVGPNAKVIIREKERILYNITREMTWMSIDIFSREVVENGNYDKYCDSVFPHVGVMLDYLFENNGTMEYCCLPDLVQAHIDNENISFSESSTRVWSRDYADMILRISSIDYDTKLKYLRHTCTSGELNSLVRLASYRSWGGFSLQSLKENIHYIRLFNYSPYVFLWLIAVFPSKPLWLLRKILRKAGATTVTRWDSFE